MDSFKLQTMMPKGGAVELQLLLKKAIKTQKLQVSRAFRGTDESGDHFRLQIAMLDRKLDPTGTPQLILVTFDRLEKLQAAVPLPTAGEGELAQRAAELEQELMAPKNICKR